jgi:hypothetical protein
MTPFGHFGGGLLVASAAEKLLIRGEFSVAALGMVIFLNILPDMDVITTFLFGKWRPGVKNARPSRLSDPCADILYLLIGGILDWKRQTTGDPIFAGTANPPAVRHLAD